MNQSPEMIAWAAGIVEGEGSISTKTGYGRVLLSVQMTDRDVLERLKEVIGGKIYNAKRQKPHHKQSWKFVLQGLPAIQAIKILMPHFLARRTAKAKEALKNYLNGPRRLASNLFQEKIAQAKHLRTLGLTHQEIASKLGWERSTASHALRGKYDKKMG